MTSKAHVLNDAKLLFNGVVASADYDFSFEGVTDGNGRVSEQYDAGADPRIFMYKWSCEMFLQATPTQYSTVDFYIAPAPDDDATMVTGDVGQADAALSDIDMLRNLTPIGSLIVEEADTTKMVADGFFICYYRYFSIVGVNNSGATVNATDSNFLFWLTPVQIQGQDT